VLSAVVTLGAVSFAGDWPQWQGPNRDAKCMETGLLKKWPEGGPKLLWTASENLGKGFSTVSIADGSIYTTGLHGKDGWLYALDLGSTAASTRSSARARARRPRWTAVASTS